MRLGPAALLLTLTLALVGCAGDEADPDMTEGDRATDTVAETVADPRAGLSTGPGGFVVGAVDDAARHPGPVLGQLADAGFGALGITSYWEPGL